MSVQIGPSFFAKELREYSSWIEAHVREAAQNGFDAPDSSTVHFTVARDGENTRVTFGNNGSPMDQDALVGKLLTMGETGKNFAAGKTGGFGKAKLLLMFAQLEWHIRTGTLAAAGTGGNYHLTDGLSYCPGTTTTVLIAGDRVADYCGAVRRFASYSQWPGTLTLNGGQLATDLRKGNPRREFAWGKVYTNRQHANVLIVRMNGVLMFARRVDYKGCVIVELTGSSGERLTANRDSLLWSLQSELDDFVLQLSVDKRSALRERRAEIKRFEGERLRNEAMRERAVSTLADVVGGAELVAALVAQTTNGPGGIATVVTSRAESAVTIGPEFLLKNTTGMATPDYYSPGPLFSDYSRKLALAWARCLLEMHKILQVSCDFSIGFVLDEETEAESSLSRVYGQVYYLNPARIVSQKDKPQCRSFKAAYTGAWADRHRIIAIAMHELVHGAYGLSRHDEDYANRLSEVTAALLPHLTRLTALFRG